MNSLVGGARLAFKLALLGLVLFPASQLRAQTVTVTRNFNDGVNVNTFAPPDSDGTVGPNNFIEFINDHFIVYNKTAAHNQLLNISDVAFWQGVGNPQNFSSLSDTHVIYDYNSQRYFAVEITTSQNTNNRVLIARTNAPGVDPSVLSNWTATSYIGRSNDFADFPMVGIDANALYINTNNFNNAHGAATDRTLTSIPKSDLLLSTPSTSNKTSFNTTAAGDSPQPVMDFSSTKGAGVVVGVPNTISNSTTLLYSRITGTSGPGATRSTVNLTVPTFNVSPNGAPQPDGTFDIDNGDGRMPNHGYQIGNDIWMVEPVQGSGGASQRSALRWYRVGYNNGGTPTLIASGTLQDDAGHYDYYNPSLAANAYGDVAISFTRSGDSTTGTSGNAGAYAFVGFTNGTTTTFGSAITLQQGLTNSYHLFGGTGERWGDYSQVSVDPNDQGAFWLINEYVVNGTTWADNIAALRVGRSITWNGSAGNGQWTTAANWSSAPLNGADLVFAGLGNSPVPTNNSDLTSIGSITFDNTAAAYTLNGSGTGASVLLLFGITNNSANTQTVNLNMTLNEAQQFNAATAALVINGTIANAGNALTVTGAANTTLTGNISGGGALLKTGAGTLVLSGTNSYTGGTTLSAGVLQVNTASLPGNVVNNASLVFDQATTGTYSGIISGSGSVIKQNVGTLILSGANTYGGGTTISAGTLQGNTTSLHGNIVNNSALVFSQSLSGNFSGTISGSGSFTKQSAGALTLTTANTFTGDTQVTGGILQLGNSSALQNSILDYNSYGGSLSFGSLTAATLGGLKGNQNLPLLNNTSQAVALTTGNATSTSYSGTLSGSGSITKSGSGTWTLTGNSTFSGGTAVSAGTLVAATPTALGTGGLAINDSASVLLQSGLGAPVQLSSLTIAGGASLTANLDITSDSLIATDSDLWSTQRMQLVTSAVEPVPEPNSLLLAALGAVTCAICGRRLRIVAQVWR